MPEASRAASVEAAGAEAADAVAAVAGMEIASDADEAADEDAGAMDAALHASEAAWGDGASPAEPAPDEPAPAEPAHGSDASGPAKGSDRRAALTPEQLSRLAVTMSDFEGAVKKVQPSAKREGFATVPGVTWKDVGALHAVREELTMSILNPIHFPERFEELGLSVPAGVLLYGPPGCGKTLLAKAIANESGANFIAVKGPELLDKYVGESEKAVRVLFQRAATSSPCVVFFDELDALAPKRGSSGGGGGVSERVVNQLLTELDGLESRRDVFVIAATNRPDIIDSAMLRPGRLDKLLYVPLPSREDRGEILRTLARKTPLADDVDLTELGQDARCERFSGADLQALVREAAMVSLRATFARDADGGTGGPQRVTKANFCAAFSRVAPSVSASEQRTYIRLRDSLRTTKIGAAGANGRSGEGVPEKR
jgi:ribosome biogenesis ATPase